jgi:hypothetical protein
MGYGANAIKVERHIVRPLEAGTGLQQETVRKVKEALRGDWFQRSGSCRSVSRG